MLKNVRNSLVKPRPTKGPARRKILQRPEDYHHSRELNGSICMSIKTERIHSQRDMGMGSPTVDKRAFPTTKLKRYTLNSSSVGRLRKDAEVSFLNC